MVNTSKSVHREDNVRDEILSKNTRVLLPTFEAALAGEISYGTNMSVPRVASGVGDLFSAPLGAERNSVFLQHTRIKYDM